MPLSDEQIQALIRLGSSQLALDQLRQAEKSYQTLLKYMPAQADALYGLAEIARRRNNPRKQQSWLEELVSVHPQHTQGVLALARLLAARQPQLALPYLERGLEALPEQGELLLESARCLQAIGQHDKARFHLEQLIQRQPLGPHAAEAWLQLAQLCLRSGELQRAGEAFERAATADPAIRHDERFVDLDADWQKIEARAKAIDWQAMEKKLGKGYEL